MHASTAPVLIYIIWSQSTICGSDSFEQFLYRDNLFVFFFVFVFRAANGITALQWWWWMDCSSAKFVVLSICTNYWGNKKSISKGFNLYWENSTLMCWHLSATAINWLPVKSMYNVHGHLYGCNLFTNCLLPIFLFCAVAVMSCMCEKRTRAS